MFGMFYFLTQFVQDILGFSPLQAGISFLPMTAALFAVSRLSPRLLARFGAKPLMVVGLLPAVAGMAWLSRISPDSTYVSGVLGPMLLLGTGMGVAFVPLTMASLAGVRPQDSGAASSMVNVTQQVGGSLGLAILVTAFATATRNAIRHPSAHLTSLAQAPQQVIVHGMASAFTLAAVFDVLASADRPAGHPRPRPAARPRSRSRPKPGARPTPDARQPRQGPSEAGQGTLRFAACPGLSGFLLRAGLGQAGPPAGVAPGSVGVNPSSWPSSGESSESTTPPRFPLCHVSWHLRGSRSGTARRTRSDHLSGSGAAPGP